MYDIYCECKPIQFRPFVGLTNKDMSHWDGMLTQADVAQQQSRLLRIELLNLACGLRPSSSIFPSRVIVDLQSTSVHAR